MDTDVKIFFLVHSALVSPCVKWTFFYFIPFRCLSYDYADDTVALLRELVKCSEGKISMLFLHLCRYSTFKAISEFDLTKVRTQDISVADENISYLDYRSVCKVHLNKPSESL